MSAAQLNAEAQRLAQDETRELNWKRWGPYLSERQWGTVREDYSANGDCWNDLPHDHARSRAYRWGEDGLLGITDRQCRLCFSVALWNGKDPILKERLFGLTGPEGNHGEDVKEQYFYLDSTPTHSYMKALYKYPQAEYPYARLVEENRNRGRDVGEFEINDTGVFAESRYFDVQAEYAKNSPDDILIKLTVSNRGPEAASVTVLPTLWFRNTWTWGCTHEGCATKPVISRRDERTLAADETTLGRFELAFDLGPEGVPELIFTENESNSQRLWNSPNRTPYVKDAFHRYVIEHDRGAVNPAQQGTKAAAVYRLNIPAGGSVTLRARLSSQDTAPSPIFGGAFDKIFTQRRAEADEFFGDRFSTNMTDEARQIARQAYAGLLWSKQFYHYAVKEWLEGDPSQPTPPESRRHGRNADWTHLFNRDVISVCDKWEYPWYAAWDLAFHMVAMARVDPHFAKEQLILFLREWYMHPSGQIPAYEFALGDVNPPVHAWAVWRVYKMTGPRGNRDRMFLARCFQKLLINFTWWVNRKDPSGRNIFAGGFLGMDNVGVFDRSRPLPTGGHLEQADGTAWMAFYCGTMLSMALELAQTDPSYEDVASKFFEHFISIIDAMNTMCGTGLWDGEDGFYYDKLQANGQTIPLKVRSMVGLVPLLAVEVLEQDVIDALPGFAKRTRWFLENRVDLCKHISYMEADGEPEHLHRLLAVPSKERLEKVVSYLLDEDEFLSPYGVRSVSKFHASNPYCFNVNGEEYRVDYTPGESTTSLFGGNSNWRGPIWFPLNFLLVEALERYSHFYADTLTVEFPKNSGKRINLKQAADEIRTRLCSIFIPDANGKRPCHAGDDNFAKDPNWKDLLLFHEYFHAETGQGLGASHQTGWTALIATLLRDPMTKRAGKDSTSRRPARV